MASESVPTIAKLKRSEQGGVHTGNLTSRLCHLKKRIQAERAVSIKARMEKNRELLQQDVSHILLSASQRAVQSRKELDGLTPFTRREPHTIHVSAQGYGLNNEDILHFESVELPYVERIPPYTTWVFLDRNQRMAAGQSVVGRQRIYYDHRSSETLVCSDSEDDMTAPHEAKHEFSVGEDQILMTALQEQGPDEDVLHIVSQFVGGTLVEIQERARVLRERENGDTNYSSTRVTSEKSLSTALDSFNNLFCRRCLIFDCRLHGCSQTSIYPPSDTQKPWTGNNGGPFPCGESCSFDLMKGCDVLSGDRSSEWNPIEEELYSKGIEMFGPNCCLITRNLLSGMKTCVEVYGYMHGGKRLAPSSSSSAAATSVPATAVTGAVPARVPRRRRGRGRKLKYSVGQTSIWKRIRGGKGMTCKQYTACDCNTKTCGKQCSCVLNGTCCEKYCGCRRSCKNRFRGCHCAKGQCRSRKCPCFAAGRECDPDTCRNCWVSCGEEPEAPARNAAECRNMRVMLRQQQKILLGKSDVAGWGAFIKDSVVRNEYIGEYTGELVSHLEADKRGKMYDRANSSFLFDLNEHYVLDACRKGDKLKFANHSSNPNCYAKVVLVAGDHRVAIFAKHNIDSGEELFYDYRYRPDHAPAWARKPTPPP